MFFVFFLFLKYKETLLKNERDTRHEDTIKENEIRLHLRTREGKRVKGFEQKQIMKF